MTTGSDLLDLSPVMPVVVLDDASDAVPTARALLAGGIPVIELTLRTEAAMESIRRIAAEVPQIMVGAGTVTTPEHARLAADAGSSFLVTPGATDGVLEAAFDTGLPFLPGAGTVSEAMKLLERGLSAVKFFPAEAAGGVNFLRSVSGPLPSLRFCPTGGITARTAGDYLALPNVGCVGGSWLTPKDSIAAKDFDTVERLARQAAALG